MHYTSLHYVTYVTLCYSMLHYVTLCYSMLHCITQLHYFTDPMLIYDMSVNGEAGFNETLDLFPKTFDNKSLQPEFSGNLYLVHMLLLIVT